MTENSYELDPLDPGKTYSEPHLRTDGEASNFNTRNQYGMPSKLTMVSFLDAGSVVVSFVSLALAVLIIYDGKIATSLGFKLQLTAFGLLLSIQGFCTSRQVCLSAISYLVYSGKATIQDLESILRNSIFSKKASCWVLVTLAMLAGLGPLLGVLYKPFFLGSSLVRLPSIDGQFGIIPPPQLDSLNGNGIALAVYAMTPFWQNRVHTNNKTYGENMLVINENATALLDTPMLSTFGSLRALLSSDQNRNQLLVLSADVNATVSTKVDIPPEELDLLAESFDHVPCEESDLSWCAGLANGWWAGMLVGGDALHKFPPAASPTVNYLGIWNHKKGESFSAVAQKFVLTRQQVRGVWHIHYSNATLKSAHVIDDSSEAASQDPVATEQLSLDLFGQLLQEYNYRWYDYSFIRSTPSFMASITWARLATLTIEDRNHLNPWYSSVNYTKPSNEYTLKLEAQTVTHSIWLVLIFVVHPTIVIIATLIKACLYKIPVSDGFGIISMLSSVSQDSLAKLSGAGYSGELRKALPVHFSIDPTTKSDMVFGKVSMQISSPHELGDVESVCPNKPQILQVSKQAVLS